MEQRNILFLKMVGLYDSRFRQSLNLVIEIQYDWNASTYFYETQRGSQERFIEVMHTKTLKDAARKECSQAVLRSLAVMTGPCHSTCGPDPGSIPGAEALFFERIFHVFLELFWSAAYPKTYESACHIYFCRNSLLASMSRRHANSGLRPRPVGAFLLRLAATLG